LGIADASSFDVASPQSIAVGLAVKISMQLGILALTPIALGHFKFGQSSHRMVDLAWSYAVDTPWAYYWRIQQSETATMHAVFIER
jgi:hypothetical protein